MVTSAERMMRLESKQDPESVIRMAVQRHGIQRTLANRDLRDRFGTVYVKSVMRHIIYALAQIYQSMQRRYEATDMTGLYTRLTLDLGLDPVADAPEVCPAGC